MKMTAALQKTEVELRDKKLLLAKANAKIDALQQELREKHEAC